MPGDAAVMQPVQSASERSWADSSRPVDNQGASLMRHGSRWCPGIWRVPLSTEMDQSEAHR